MLPNSFHGTRIVLTPKLDKSIAKNYRPISLMNKNSRGHKIISKLNSVTQKIMHMTKWNLSQVYKTDSTLEKSI